MKSNFERVNPNLAVLIAGSKIKKRRTAVRGKRTVGLTEGRMAGGRGGLPAKRAVTCWVCNWWAEKSTAFCPLPVSLHLQRSALITRFSRDLKVFFSASQIALTYSIIRTLKCMSADLWEMSPASDCVHFSQALWNVSFRNFSTVLWVLAAWFAWFWTAAFYFAMLMVLFLCRGIAAQMTYPTLRLLSTSILNPFQAGTHTKLWGRVYKNNDVQMDCMFLENKYKGWKLCITKLSIWVQKKVGGKRSNSLSFNVSYKRFGLLDVSAGI